MPLKANIRAREEWPTLPAMVPLAVEIADTPKLDTGSKYGNEQAKILFEVFDGPYSAITIEDPVTHLPKIVRGRFMGYFGLTMASTTSGQRSMLRQLVEAIYGPLTDDQANAIDLEPLKGQRAVVVGNYADPNAEQLRFKPIGFSSYVAGQVSAPTPVAAVPAPVAPAAEVSNGLPTLVQTSPDGAHGWDGASWRPIAEFSPPAAAVPPPPPPPVATPPPAPVPPPPAAAVAPPAPEAPAAATPPPPPPAAPAARKVNF